MPGRVDVLGGRLRDTAEDDLIEIPGAKARLSDGGGRGGGAEIGRLDVL